MTEEKQKEYNKHCDHEDYCHSYQMRRMNEIPPGWICEKKECEYDSRSRPYDIDAIKAAEREKTITLFEEIENGISSYEKENEHKQVHDECKGIYIPINVVRRLITVRKESLLKLLSCDSQDGG